MTFLPESRLVKELRIRITSLQAEINILRVEVVVERDRANKAVDGLLAAKGQRPLNTPKGPIDKPPADAATDNELHKALRGSIFDEMGEEEWEKEQEIGTGRRD